MSLPSPSAFLLFVFLTAFMGMTTGCPQPKVAKAPNANPPVENKDTSKSGTKADQGVTAQKTAPATVTLTDKDNGAKQALKKGDTLDVKLEMQAGTGFSWEIAKSDAAQLKPIGEPTIEKADATKPGSPELQVFRFEAIAVGTSDLELQYKRPFDKDKAPDKTYKVTIQIGDGK